MPDPTNELSPISCTSCDHALRADTRFCPNCGQGIGVGTAHHQTIPFPRQDNGFEQRWTRIQDVVWLFGGMLACSFAVGMFWRFASSVWALPIGTTFELTLVAAFGIRRWRDISALFGAPKIDSRAGWQMAFVAILFVIGLTGYFRVLPMLGVPVQNQSSLMLKAACPVPYIYLLLSFLPAVIEEIGFRGVIQSTLEPVLGKRDAWLTQAALFSVLHLSPIIFVSHFIMGLCFGYLRNRSRSLYPGMWLHASWNALVLTQEIYL